MSEIKFVRQEDSHGCAIACIAMVLGKTYKEIAADFENDFTQSGIMFDQTMTYLGNAGFSIIHKEVKRWNEINFARKEMLKPFAPVHIVRVVDKFDSEGGHLVVMTDKGKLLCPDELKDSAIRNKCYSITDVLGLYR